MELGLKDCFVGWLVGGWLVDTIFLERGCVWVFKCLVLISPNNCLCLSSHCFRVHGEKKRHIPRKAESLTLFQVGDLTTKNREGDEK